MKPETPFGLDILCYDIEIKYLPFVHKGVTWQTHDKMKSRVAVVFDFKTRDYKVYFEEDVPMLIDDLNAAKLVTGFNICGFDHKVIKTYGDLDCKSYDSYYASRDASKASGARPGGLKLDDHLECMFNMKKTEDGSKVHLMNDAKVTSYCIADVRRETLLFNHIWMNGWVETFKHGRREVVDPWEFYNEGRSH